MGAEAAVWVRGLQRTSTAASVLMGRQRRDDRGAVTAEAAAVLPVLVVVTLLMVWLVSVAAAQVRVVDGAREAARQAARGEPDAVAIRRGAAVAPSGTTFSVDRAGSGDTVEVTAVAEVQGPGGVFAFLPRLSVRAETVAVREPR